MVTVVDVTSRVGVSLGEVSQRSRLRSGAPCKWRDARQSPFGHNHAVQSDHSADAGGFARTPVVEGLVNNADPLIPSKGVVSCAQRYPCRPSWRPTTLLRLRLQT